MKKIFKKIFVSLLTMVARTGLVSECRERIYAGEDIIEKFSQPNIKTDTMEHSIYLTLKRVFYKHKHYFNTKGGKHLFTVSEDTHYNKRLELQAELVAFIIEKQWMKVQAKTFVYKHLESPMPVDCVQIPEEICSELIVVEHSKNNYKMARDFTHEPSELFSEIVTAFYNDFKEYLQKQILKTTKYKEELPY